jgi:hypothetical protein
VAPLRCSAFRVVADFPDRFNPPGCPPAILGESSANGSYRIESQQLNFRDLRLRERDILTALRELAPKKAYDQRWPEHHHHAPAMGRQPDQR